MGDDHRVKRLAIVLALALTAAAALALPAQAEREVDSYCSETGDYCTAISRAQGKVFLSIQTFSFTDKYKLCVEPPDGDRECGYFWLKKGKHGVYASKVDFRGSYFSHGKGRYKVTWFYGRKTRLGPPLFFRINADLP